MDVQLHCVIKRGFSWRGKNEFFPCVFDAVRVKYRKGTVPWYYLVNREFKSFLFKTSYFVQYSKTNQTIFLGYLQSLQLNFCNIIDKLLFICLKGVHKCCLPTWLNVKSHSQRAWLHAIFLALTREQRGASVSFCEVCRNIHAFLGQKYLLYVFFCKVGAGLTSLLWNLSPTFPCKTDWKVI